MKCYFTIKTLLLDSPPFLNMLSNFYKRKINTPLNGESLWKSVSITSTRSIYGKLLDVKHLVWKSIWVYFIRGFARFPEFVQNVCERQILWSLCSVDFHSFTCNCLFKLYILWRLTSKFLWVHLETVKISAKRVHPRFFTN